MILYHRTMKKNLVREEKVIYSEGFLSESRLCRISHTLPHFHKTSLELVYCLRGCVFLVTGEQKVTLTEDCVFSVDANEIHYISNASGEDNLLLIFHLDLSRSDSCFINGEPVMFTCEGTHLFPYQQEAMNSVKDIILALAASQFGNKDNPGRKASETRLKDILLKYFDWYNYNNHDEYINPELRDRFYSLFTYCMKNYRSKISASDLAEREHLNYNYFSQFLTTTVFKSFSSMVKYVRCFRAHHLLLETDLPNCEIAYSVGFSDPKYFYHAFRQWWDCSPKDARNSCTKQFHNVLNNDKSIEIIDDFNALEIIEKYITEWHIKKIFSY